MLSEPQWLACAQPDTTATLCSGHAAQPRVEADLASFASVMASSCRAVLGCDEAWHWASHRLLRCKCLLCSQQLRQARCCGLQAMLQPDTTDSDCIACNKALRWVLPGPLPCGGQGGGGQANAGPAAAVNAPLTWHARHLLGWHLRVGAQPQGTPEARACLQGSLDGRASAAVQSGLALRPSAGPAAHRAPAAGLGPAAQNHPLRTAYTLPTSRDAHAGPAGALLRSGSGAGSYRIHPVCTTLPAADGAALAARQFRVQGSGAAECDHSSCHAERLGCQASAEDARCCHWVNISTSIEQAALLLTDGVGGTQASLRGTQKSFVYLACAPGAGVRHAALPAPAAAGAEPGEPAEGADLRATHTAAAAAGCEVGLQGSWPAAAGEAAAEAAEAAVGSAALPAEPALPVAAKPLRAAAL